MARQMKITQSEIARQYKNLRPELHELPGDLARMAEIVERHSPGNALDIVLEIAAEFRGTYIYCHAMAAMQRAARDRLIVDVYGEGARVPDISRAVTLTERQVWSILGRAQDDDRQGRLF